MAEKVENRRDAARWSALAVSIGCVAILTGLVANQWLLGRVISPKGAFGGRTNLIISVVDLLFLCLGAFFVIFRKKLSLVLARIASKYGTLTSLLFGIGCSLALIAVFEAAFFALNAQRSRGSKLNREYSPGLLGNDALLGHRPSPNTRHTEKVTFGDKTLFDAAYTVDENRCRIVLQTPTAPVDSALIFFGCSFTFGTGVQDSETLPSNVARLGPHWHVYNFGGIGDGPHQMLARLQQTDLRSIVRERTDSIVYVFIPQHIERIMGRLRHIAVWGRNDPWFDLRPDDTAVYLGPYRAAHPWRTLVYDVFLHEQALQYMNADWPLGIGERDIVHFSRMLKTAKLKAKEVMGNGDFHVLFYPLSHRVMQNLGVDWEKVKSIFLSDGLDVLDYRDTFKDDEDMFYPRDEHPTAKAHEAIAKRIAADLQLY
jgi:hypothetical protein